jgi:hypothetical protein
MIKLKKGDRIRLKVRTISGWKGTGTVSEDQIDDTIFFHKDGEDINSWIGGRNCACRHEAAKLRESTVVGNTFDNPDIISS